MSHPFLQVPNLIAAPHIRKSPGDLWAPVFLRFFPLPNSGAYGPIASVKLALGFWKCTSVYFLLLIGTFDTLKVIEVFPDARIWLLWSGG
jgi:hypothetical protein